MFDLNDHQQRAVDHEGGPLLVLAGAGSGKTGTLAHRVARLLRTGADPDRVCLVTFSRRAAQELLQRAGRLTDTGAAGRVWGGTFHSVANRVLRLHGRRLGLDPGFSILDSGDVTELFGLIRSDLGLHHNAGSAGGAGNAGSAGGAGNGGADGPHRRSPRASTLASIYDRVVNTGERLPVVLQRWFPWCGGEAEGIKAAFEAYVVRKRERQLLDYDDLLLCWRALGAVPGLLPDLFDHVLVDEYQDTNTLQADILAALCPSGAGLTVVGDDAQAIYGFRAASSGNLLDFPVRFPGTTVVRLEQNYRSTPPIVAVANAVMAEAASGTAMTKVLWSARAGTRRPLMRTCGDEDAEAAAPRVPAPARPELGGLRSALGECADGCLPGGETPPPAVQVERLGQWLGPVMERTYDHAAARKADLRQLEGVAANAPSRSRFVSDLTLDPPSSTADLAGPPLVDEDWLVLSTVHSAKGGEWEVVHVLHASDGMFPSDMATGDPEGIEEERRLLYVAVTRARSVLEVNAPLRYHHRRRPLADAHSYAQVSRFLSSGVTSLMDEVHVEGRPRFDDGGGPSGEMAVVDGGLAGVDRALADLWA